MKGECPLLAFPGLVSSEGERRGKMAALAGELCALSEEARGPAAGAIGLHPRDEPWGDVTCHLRGLALKAHHCSKVRP